MKIVGVVGDSKKGYPELSTDLGQWLATMDVHLLTGGGAGVMEAVSKAFYETPNRKGVVIGIIPRQGNLIPYQTKEGYPNPYVEIPIYTHLHGFENEKAQGKLSPKGMFSRNHINALSATLIIALPGGGGTYAEIQLARDYGKPVIAYLGKEGEISNRNSKALAAENFKVAEGLEEVQEFLKDVL